MCCGRRKNYWSGRKPFSWFTGCSRALSTHTTKSFECWLQFSWGHWVAARLDPKCEHLISLAWHPCNPLLHLKPYSNNKPYPLTHTDLCLSLCLRYTHTQRRTHNTLHRLYPHTDTHTQIHPPAHRQLTQLKACRAYRGRKHGRHAESYLANAFSNVKCMRVHVKAGVRVAQRELRRRYETELRLKCIRAERFWENVSPLRERQVY